MALLSGCASANQGWAVKELGGKNEAEQPKHTAHASFQEERATLWSIKHWPIYYYREAQGLQVDQQDS